MSQNGIVHLWDLPENEVYVELKESYKAKILASIKLSKHTYKKFSKLIDIPYHEIQSFIRGHTKPLSFIIKIVKFLSQRSLGFSLEILEKNIKSLSTKAGFKILDPKLPFNFNSVDGAIVISAILHDGSLTRNGVVYYQCMKEKQRKIVYESTKNILGEFKTNKKITWYPKIVGYILRSLGLKMGPKMETNPHVPLFLFTSPKEIISAFLGQAIADDGSVVFNEKNKTREISLALGIDVSKLPPEKIYDPKYSTQLLQDNKKLLEKLGIQTKGPTIFTEKLRKSRSRGEIHKSIIWEIFITDRENLEKFYKKIKIPLKYKQDGLKKMVKSYKQLGSGQLPKLIIREVIKREKITVPQISRKLKRDPETIREVVQKLVKTNQLKTLSKGSGSKPNVYIFTGS